MCQTKYIRFVDSIIPILLFSSKESIQRPSTNPARDTCQNALVYTLHNCVTFGSQHQQPATSELRACSMRCNCNGSNWAGCGYGYGRARVRGGYCIMLCCCLNSDTIQTQGHVMSTPPPSLFRASSVRSFCPSVRFVRHSPWIYRRSATNNSQYLCRFIVSVLTRVPCWRYAVGAGASKL